MSSTPAKRRAPIPWARLLLAATASLMMALGSPPNGHTWMIWLGFIPLMIVLRLTSPQHRRLAFAYGLVGGLCTGLVGFPWIAELVVRFAELPWVVGGTALLLFSLWTALPIGLWAVAVVSGPNTGWRGVIWPIAWWVAVADLWPHLFPYTLVIGFAEAPVWMQAAEFGGVAAVEAQVMAVGVFAADAIVGPRHSVAHVRRWKAFRGVAAAAIVALSTAWGAWRLASVDAELATARTVRVGIVQPNNALADRNTTERMDKLRSMSASAQSDGAQMIVWPEAGAFPFSIRRPFLRDSRRPSYRILSGFSLPTIFGAGTYASDEKWERNSVYHLAADGTVQARYDKTVLVPIGEYVPVIDPNWVQGLVPAVSHNIAGDGPARFEVKPAPTEDDPTPAPVLAGPLVCYEDIMPTVARATAAQAGGVELFVNVTIDTWFGETAEPWEHLALAQFRSVEHRIPMVRSVSAGVSTSIDAGGRVVGQLPVTGPTLTNPVAPMQMVTEVALPRNTAERPTVYARVGWLIPWLCQAWALGVVGFAVLARIRRKPYKQPRSSPDGGDEPEYEDP